MGECYIQRRGGNAGLNFKVVVGTTQPANPKENTIWINTSEKFASWIFSNEDPLATGSTWGIESEGNNKTLYTLSSRSYYKVNAGKAVYTLTSTTGEYWAPLLVSPDPDAVATVTSYKPEEIKTYGGTVEYNGKTYYYCRAGYGMGGTITATPRITTAISNEEAALYLAEKYDKLGTVWIQTGTISDAAFNAVKKNQLVVYPVGVYGYVDGTKQKLEASIFYGGEWVSLSGRNYLYNYGDACEDVTGGWKTGMAYNGSVKTDGLTLGADSMVIAGQATSHFGAAATTNKITLSGYTKLNALVKVQSTSGDAFMAVCSQLANFSSNKLGNKSLPSAEGVISIDVSSMSAGYVVFSSGTSTATIKAVWLE